MSLESLRKEYDKTLAELSEDHHSDSEHPKSRMKYVNHLEEGMDYRTWYRERCVQKLAEIRKVV